jgi:hypothetical protein
MSIVVLMLTVITWSIILMVANWSNARAERERLRRLERHIWGNDPGRRVVR